MSEIAPGLYEALVDEHLHNALSTHPELRTVFGKIDPEEQPSRYAMFISKVLEQALREEHDPKVRLAICNHIIDGLSNSGQKQHLVQHKLIDDPKPVLLEVTPPFYGSGHLPRPQTPLSESSLFTGSPQDPELSHELQEEMRSCDKLDVLVSFIKWSGLRLLMSAFEDLRSRDVKVRVITTSYMGASGQRQL